MTATLPDVTPRKKSASSPELDAAKELVRLAKEQGLALTGPDGLLKALTKTVLETALHEGLSEHLGYDKHDSAGAGSGNIRNGTRAKTVLTDTTGPVTIDVPRDRVGTFDPQIVPKRQRRLPGVDEIVLSLYAKGLTTGEISAHFAQIYGASVSKETISRHYRQGRRRDAGLGRTASRWGVRGGVHRRDPGQGSRRAGSPTGPSMPPSGSASRATRTCSGCGPVPAAKARSSGWPCSPTSATAVCVACSSWSATASRACPTWWSTCGRRRSCRPHLSTMVRPRSSRWSPAPPRTGPVHKRHLRGPDSDPSVRGGGRLRICQRD